MADNIHNVKIHRKSKDLAGKVELGDAKIFNILIPILY